MLHKWYSSFYSDTFNSVNNTDVVKLILKEVRMLNPEFQTGHIRSMFCFTDHYYILHCDNIVYAAALYTYYRSLRSENRLQKKGLKEQRNVARRRRERLLRVS